MKKKSQQKTIESAKRNEFRIRQSATGFKTAILQKALNIDAGERYEKAEDPLKHTSFSQRMSAAFNGGKSPIFYENNILETGEYLGSFIDYGKRVSTVVQSMVRKSMDTFKKSRFVIKMNALAKHQDEIEKREKIEI